MSIVVNRVMGWAQASAPDGMRVIAIRSVATPSRDVQTLRAPLLGTGGGLLAPTVHRGAVRLRAPVLSGQSGLYAPTVRAGSTRLRPPLLGAGGGLLAPTARPGAVRLSAPLLASEAGLYTPTVRPGPVRLRAPLLQSTSGLYAPSISLSSSWFDDPEFDPWQFIHAPNVRRSAIWTGEPKVGNRWPKREATVAEVLAVMGPAGRGYMPEPGGDYQFDTAENAPRYDAYRGQPQLAIDPLPRFNRLFPSGVMTQAVTLPMIAYPYVFGFSGSPDEGFDCAGNGVGSNGSWSIRGQGEGVWTWGIMPHSTSDPVTITPVGAPRWAQADTHGVTGLDPDYPTIVIPTTTERVDQAAEIISPAAAVMEAIRLNGTILVQGQFWARPAPGQRRTILGWDYSGHISIDSAGNALCSANGGNLSVPTGGDGGDPFRVVVAFRERDEGQWRFDGITRLSANGSQVAEFAQRYGAGLGEHLSMFLGRMQNMGSGAESGAGGYDLLCFTSDLLDAETVQTLSVYPDWQPGHSPTRAVEALPGVGGISFGATGEQGSIYEGYRMVDGDDFDDTTDADFVSPQNGAGRYMTTRHYGVQSGAPRYLRGAASLGGYEADPWHTGYADANRGQVPASYADLIQFGDGALRTKTRRATAFERAIMGPLNGKNNLSAMVHMGRRNMMRAPCVMEMRLRFPHALSAWNQYHPTFWLLQSQPGNGWDGLEIDCEGFTPELGLYRNTWNAGTLVNTGQLGSTQAVSQTEYRTYTFEVAQDDQGVWMMYLYEDGVLRGSGTCSSGSFVFDPTRPFHLMQTSHILQNGLTQSIFDAAGDTGATMDCDFWRVWQPTGAVFREPLVDHQEFFADFGANFSLALATPQEVWGPDVTADVIENIPHEDNTPGAPWQRGLLPAGVTRTGNTINGRFNDRPGRLIMARSATPAAGDGCIPQTITLNIGPQIRASTIQYQVGVAGSFDLYAACDCGDLFVGKVVTVTGLPAWASYNAATGMISWTNPPDAGTIAFSVSVTNSQGQSATASVSLVRQIVITGFIYDSFTDANGTRLGDHVGEDGVGWYAPGNISGNGGVIQNNRASPLTNNVMIYRKQIEPPSNDYEVTATFDKLTQLSGESSGILLRNSGEGEQGYLVRTNGSQWGILRMTATGASTSLGTYNDTFANGTSRTIRFRVVGSVLTLFINDVAVITVTDTTNAYQSGRVGVRMLPPRTATTGIHITHIEARVV